MNDKQTQPEYTREPILKLCSVRAGYGQREVIDNVSLSLRSGEKVLLVGPNGCGKSTLIKAVVGQAEVFAGRIIFDGRELLGLSTDRRIRSGLAYLPQARNIFRSLTVKENLELSHLKDGHYSASQSLEFVFEAFPPLREKLRLRAGALSGGERQALAIGMTVRAGVKLYLLDEPTAGLAPKTAAEILDGIRKLQETLQFACLIVEHNLRQVCSWVDRAVIMSDGRLAGETERPEELLERKFLEKHYFQENG